MLFNLYVERAFAEAVSESDLGTKVNSVPINNIRYVDDTAIPADSTDALQALLKAIHRRKYWIKHQHKQNKIHDHQ